MIERVRVSAYGRAAAAVLAEEVAAAKAGDALAPVTVVVPSNTAGLSARRALGAGSFAALGGGLANVSFLTPYRLAELLGRRRAASAGLAWFTTPELGAAIRRSLCDDPGFFAPVAGHHATEAALVDLYAELSRARNETLDRLAEQGSERAQAVVRLFGQVRTHLTGYADEDAIARAAGAALADGDHEARALGTVVVFLPQPLPPALSDLLATVGEHRPVRVIVGCTGDAEADGAVRALCRRAGWAPAGEVPSAPTGTRVVTVSDTDEEVRAAVRLAMAHAERGVPLDRIAILYPGADPYARTLHDQLRAAGIPHNGPPLRRLVAGVAGRTLVRVLDLAREELPRDAVCALLASAPVVDGTGSPAPGPRWDLVSRRAGVVGGITDWDAKLAAFAEGERARAVALAEEGASDGRVAAARRDAEEALALRDFVLGLHARLESLRGLDGWSDRSAWARGALGDLLGSAPARADWPEAEADAFDRVDAALLRLAALDAIEPHPGHDVFARAVRAELDAPMGRSGHFGEGILCGPFALGIGLEVDVVVLLGLAEGSAPSPRRDDSLVPDADRELAVEGELTTREQRIRDQHRAFLAALAAGTVERVLVAPRGDHRSGRERRPSRWLLDTVSALAGTTVYGSELADTELPELTAIASFSSGLVDAPAAVSLVERDLATFARHAATGRDPSDHHAVSPEVVRGLELARARASDAFTRWDGNLAGSPVPSPATGQILSATRLETWARCPFQYFLGSVLGLGRTESPEQVLEMSPLERGSLFHEVLERFLAPVVATPPADRIAPDVPWPPEERARLLDIADEVCTAFEARGVTGRPLLWRILRESLIADLEGWMTADDEHRATRLATPEQVEMAFGLDGEPALDVALPDGRSIAFRGKADRVDRTPDGRLLVLDYKTGKGAGYEGLDDDPVDGGRHLQLPLYAAAAQARFGGPAEAAYWFATRDGGYRQHPVVLDEATLARFSHVLGEIVDGIEHGEFPAAPGEENWYFGTYENCAFCDFDDLCPADRGLQADAKAAAPGLVRFRALAGLDEELDEEDGE